jgi:RNA polymerase sigma-70 factor, ECF subfamily
MSSDTAPLALPLWPLAADTCEATTLYRELRRPLLRYLICLGLSSDEAQDVVQDAFLGLHRHLAAGGDRENIRSWVFRVAHNRARNHQKRYDRRFSAPLEAGLEAVIDEKTPERVMLEKEKFGRLDAAIRQLPEAERECLLLRAGGLRYREISDVLGVPTSTVADTVARAIRKLAEECNV